MSPALYRERPGADWQECEIIGQYPGGRLVLREVGKVLPGYWMADPDCVRVPVAGLNGLALLNVGEA